jgi:DNA-binding transcriptional LysR family regulator
VSQPGLSQSIALLERELGAKVLDRGRHGARLNEIGDALIFHAQALETLLDRASDEVRMRALGLEGPLAIGITPVTAVGMVPRALDLLLHETPGVSVSVTEGLDKEIMHLLRTRQLDLLVSRLGVGPDYPDVEAERLFAADWALITGPRHPLADRPSLRLSELSDVQWVLPTGGSAFREQMERVFASVGQGWPRRGIVTNSILAIKDVVMNSDCVSIISPRLVEVEVAMGRLRAIPLVDVRPLQPVGLIWRRDDKLSPIAARFAKILRSFAQEE